MWTEKFNNGLSAHVLQLHGLKNSRNSSYLINHRCDWTLNVGKSGCEMIILRRLVNHYGWPQGGTTVLSVDGVAFNA